MDVEEFARSWVRGYSAAWSRRDPEGVAALYADDCVYRSLPFRDPHLGRAGVLDYTRATFGREMDADFWFGAPIASGDRAAIEYWAVILEAGGTIASLAGTVVLRFDGSGRCVEHRDTWALEEGRHSPYDGWDR